MLKLTALQQKTLDFIIGHIEDNGYPPTCREMAAKFGICFRAAHDRLLWMERKGAIVVEPGVSRGIRIPGVRWKMVREARP